MTSGIKTIVLSFALTFLIAPTAHSLCLCVKCLTNGFHHFVVMSGSMRPTLEPSACLTIKMRNGGDPLPDPGQIIGFVPEHFETVHISRVVALPCQTVQRKDDSLILDRTPVPQPPAPDYQQLFAREPTGDMPRCSIPRFTETLPNGASYEILDILPDEWGDTTDVCTVPEGHV